MSFKKRRSKKKTLKRIIIIICFSMLIIAIVILILPKKSYASPSFSLNRLKSILKNVIKKDSKPRITEASNTKELIDEQNKNFFRKKSRSFRLLIKDLRRKYLKIQKKYFKKYIKETPYSFQVNMKNRGKRLPLSQRTTKLSTLIQQDQLQFENDFKQFSKFMWSYYYREQGIDISKLFDYPIGIVDSYILLPHIHPVRCLNTDPFYLEPLKRVNFGVFDYSNIKSVELINLGNPWF